MCERIETNRLRSERGFSVVELLVVLVIVGILITLAIFYGTAHEKLYKPDDQSLQITDMLQEARQRSLTQRETMRVEVSLSAGRVRLIDENDVDTADDDDVLKTFILLPATDVTIATPPSNISYNPPEPLPAPTAVFVQSVYPDSLTESVLTMRFMANGTVTNAGNDSVGTGAIVRGVSLHVWAPKPSDNSSSDIARAITVIGSTGTIRLWEHDEKLAVTNKWKDSRRYGSYGAAPAATPTP
jgi:prepilin-type N-terminal cleavage/methylation domain